MPKASCPMTFDVVEADTHAISLLRRKVSLLGRDVAVVSRTNALPNFVDNIAAESIMIRPFVHDLKDSAMWAKACLTECEEKHPKCAFPHSGFAPSRLLKIERIDGAAKLHVRLQSLPVGDFQAGTKYATLSYCWGRRQSFKLDKQTENLLTTGISATSCLPKTLSDAVEVAWDLGISWIWIDCLCIRQDDENEKAAEVAKMHLIYQHSYITISASKAVDCYQGFLHQTSLPSAGSRGYILPFSSPCGRLGSVVLCWGDATSPVDKRSWTLQEHLLARRVLRYTDFQLHWTCAEVAMHEVKEETSLPTVHWRKLEKACRLSSYIRDKDRNCEGWMTLVEEYTTRNLTKRFDILPAMSGIAESWDNQSQDQYLAGLWMSHLPLGLLWTCAQPNEQLRWEPYRAPSWSWASREGQIDWINEMALPVDPELSIQEASVQPTHRDAPFGAVESGFIRLQGRLQSAVLPGGGWPWRGASVSGLLEPLGLDLALTHIDDWNAPTYTSGFDTTIHALQICPYSEASGRGPWGLVLAKIGPDTYRRIGVFDFQPPQEDEAKETDNFLALRQHWAARKKTQQRAFRESGLSIITIV